MKTRSLFVLAAIFGISFAGRAVVFASDVKKSATDSHTPASKPASHENSDAACLDPQFAASLKETLQGLEARQLVVAEREQLLSVYEKQIEKRLAEMSEANTQLEGAVGNAQGAMQADINKVAAIYAGMKPQQASAIVDKMDPAFAAGLLASMNSESAAQIVASMEAQKAYTITVLMANRYHQE